MENYCRKKKIFAKKKRFLAKNRAARAKINDFWQKKRFLEKNNCSQKKIHLLFHKFWKIIVARFFFFFEIFFIVAKMIVAKILKHVYKCVNDRCLHTFLYYIRIRILSFFERKKSKNMVNTVKIFINIFYFCKKYKTQMK